jgi:SIR2-like domain
MPNGNGWLRGSRSSIAKDHSLGWPFVIYQSEFKRTRLFIRHNDVFRLLASILMHSNILNKSSTDRIFDLSNPKYLADIHKIVAKGDIAFIVGSAISKFDPTGMPNGIEVTNAIAQKISENLSHQDLVESEIRRAPFETIFQAYPERATIKRLLYNLYGQGKPNNIHKSIANARRSKRYDIITTNYDRCLELSVKGWHVMLNEVNFLNRPRSKRLLKIHGSVEAHETLVFTIDAEAPLSGWKKESFNEIVDGKIAILVGYSGLDFEICPALMSSKATHILWNIFPKNGKLEFPSQNAEHIFKNDSRCKILLGDMKDIFDDSSSVPSKPNDIAINDFLKSTPREEILQWKIRLLDSLGLCLQAKEALEKNRMYLDSRFAIQSEIAIEYRAGRYLTSAKKSIEEASQFYLESNAELKGSSGAAFRFRNFGSHYNAHKNYKKALFAWLKVGRMERDDARLNLLWLGTLIRLKQKRGTARALRLARQMAILSLKKGKWGQYYLVQPLLERHGIDVAREVGIRAPLLPAQQGFLHIGNLSSRIDDFTGAMPKTRPSRDLVASHISEAGRAGLYPNLWKCALAGMIYCGDRSLQFRGFLFWNFCFSLHKCQYAIVTKIAIYILGFGAFSGLSKRSQL